MDPKGMEPFVDWFGFMAYDLHGSWDAEVKTIGALVRAQTDLRDIVNNTLPLWFDKLDPAKINMGLAYYGRGFTLTDKSCNYIGCSFSSPSKPAPCTNFKGIMSHREIKQLIKEKKLTPTLIDEAQIKQITWDDQWIGYDDSDTIAAKIQTANSLCMGGTMIWSIDFDSGSGSGDVPDDIIGAHNTSTFSGGGDNPGSGSGGNAGSGSSGGGGSGSGLVYVDPTIWTDAHPLVACEPPCVLVLPPVQLPSPTVISFPPLTTTYLAGAVAGAGQGGLPTLVTVTTMVAIPPVTTTEIQMWAVTIFTNDTTAAIFAPVQSVTPPPVTVTFPGPSIASQSMLDDTVTTSGPRLMTVYPQPTFSVDFPAGPVISYTRAPPTATCTAYCGSHNCKLFGCGGDCSLFGCAGNCGLLGCGGGCGLFACGGACGILGCGGCGLLGCGRACPGCALNLDTIAGHTIGGEDADENEDDGNDDDDDDEDGEEDESDVCVLQEADLGEEGSAEGSSPGDGSTEPSNIPGSTSGQHAPSPVTSPLGLSTTIGISITKAPGSTQSPGSTMTDTRTNKATASPPQKPPPSPEPNAVCQHDNGDTLDWYYTLSGLKGTWVSDGGSTLYRAVKSRCLELTDWTWDQDENDGKGARARFRVSILGAKGCVGKAIGAALGPEIDC